MLKQQKGVTLVALVITIIVLLILAGVSIAMLTGDNGVLTKAKSSQSETVRAEAKEKVSLAINTIMANKADTSSTSEDPKQITVENIVTVINREGGTAINVTEGVTGKNFKVKITIGNKIAEVTGTEVTGKTDVFTLDVTNLIDKE